MSNATAFVESCIQTAAGKAASLDRGSRGKPKAHKLMRVLADKKNILVTTHMHPDPDALGSSLAMCSLLRAKLKDAKVSMSIKGRIGGGINDAFTRHAQLNLIPWDEDSLDQYDAIILLDVQPTFAYNPLPPHIVPTAVIDHHRAPGRKLQCPFPDIRPEVGANCSIVFSYFMELETPIDPALAATMLYAIESDLAGAAGMPATLDNMALSSLTLVADTNRLYQMRYVDLPQNYYAAYFTGLKHATVYDNVLVSHIEQIDSLEQPAIIADFLLRYDKVQWAMVTAEYEGRLIFSIRSSDPKRSAGEIARRVIRNIGEGGGHHSKAGGFVRLENGSATEIERQRTIMRNRFLRSLRIKSSRGSKLV